MRYKTQEQPARHIRSSGSNSVRQKASLAGVVRRYRVNTGLLSTGTLSGKLCPRPILWLLLTG